MNKPTPQQILAYNIYHRPSIWAQHYTTLKGQPYRFERFKPDGTYDFAAPQLQRGFLQEPLDDPHPHKSTRKSRQLGLSENGVRECLWFADTHKFTKQVYTFPTNQQVKDFSRTRIDSVVNDSPYLLKRMGIDPTTRKRISSAEDVVDNVHLKKVGDSFIFFRSGATPKAGEGIDCDVVYFDEIDRMHPQVTVAFNETLSASPYGWRRDISTPSLPGVGVDGSFQRSDQRYWFMKCKHCNHWFTLIMDFPRCIAELPPNWAQDSNHWGHSYPHILSETDTHVYMCTKCGKPVDNETRIKGIWHPLYPNNKAVRGYQLSQLFAPWISATELMAKRELYKIEQLFVNYVLGLPYLGDNILITEAEIRRCIDTSLTDPNALKLRNVVVGGDWGNDSWQIVGMPHPDDRDKWIILDLFTISDRDRSGEENPHIQFSTELFHKWRANLGVYDAGYGKDRNFELLNRFPGKIYSCFYPNNHTDYTKDFGDRWEDNGYKVNVDRTMTLKIMMKKFKDQEVVIPEWIAKNPAFPTFVKHLTNLVSIRNIEEDSSGKETITERVGALPGGDHFGHAMNYLAIGLRKIGNRPKSAFIF